ncbi:pentatricopeptide repeat domain containing protein [Acanthamoeba castellanii str. Neff]|uniref:Pentatricopeptide repeat domain containing protein n=1 Tax=Acanthamoeba castellanii (strain ATCC 30010 / Neff) TaxID=1257118 RepID=L8H4N1_ACACF|nr:pentatricopeptide repeat domain containing protein [Acanthamoeba castellanii str. Neff]ELR19688.1 pentatricopeptide repeat domain containing protein [Acanthamoeba castellanii str. Neff]
MSRFSAFGRRAPVQLLPSAMRINGNSFWLAGRPSICGNGASCGLQLLCSAASVSRFSSTHSLAQNDVLLESQQLAKQGNFSKASELASAFVKEHEALPLESATYTALIDVFARAKRLDKAHSLLRDMEAKANRPDSVGVADAVYDKLVDEGATLDAEFYDAYISSLVGARKFRRAHQIYFHMSKRQKLPATATTYKNLITIYGESKRWDLVQDVLRKMASRNVLTEAAEGIDEAFAWVERLGAEREKSPNEKVYNSLIEACCLDADTLDRSWRALRNMKKAGVRPSTRTYNAILAGHSKFGRSGEISTVLEEMTKDEVPKDSYTYSLLVRAYASAADMRKAFDLYSDYKAAGFPPRHDLCNHLLNGLRQQAHTSHGEQGADSACQEGVSEALAHADALFDEMVQADMQINAFSFFNLIQANHLARNNGKALELYDEMKRRGVQLNARLVHLMGAVIATETDRLVLNGQF